MGGVAPSELPLRSVGGYEIHAGSSDGAHPRPLVELQRDGGSWAYTLDGPRCLVLGWLSDAADRAAWTLAVGVHGGAAPPEVRFVDLDGTGHPATAHALGDSGWVAECRHLSTVVEVVEAGVSVRYDLPLERAYDPGRPATDD